MSEGETGNQRGSITEAAEPTTAADPTMASPTTATTTTSQHVSSHRKTEALILLELSSTLDTLQNVSVVLEDIVRLTTSPQPTSSNSGTSKKKGDQGDCQKKKRSMVDDKSSIVGKQQKLLKELGRWKQLGPPMGE